MNKMKRIVKNKFFKLNFFIVGLLAFASYQIQNQIKAEQNKMAAQVKNQNSNVSKWMKQRNVFTAHN